MVECESEKQNTAVTASPQGAIYERLQSHRQKMDPLLPFKYRMSRKEVVIWAADQHEADVIYSELRGPAG